MAINSAAKRMSAASVALDEAYVPPDGTLAQGDRQTIALCYGGILATASAVVSGLLFVFFSMKKPSLAFTMLKPKMRFVHKKPKITFS